MPLVTYKVTAKDKRGVEREFDVNGGPKTTEELKAHCVSLGLTYVGGAGSDGDAEPASRPDAE